MRNIDFKYPLILLLLLVSCAKDSPYIPFSPKIIEVEGNYNLENGATVKVKIEGKNAKDIASNTFYIEGIEIPSKEILNEVAFDIVLPPTTFSAKKMSNELSFYNGHEYAKLELFAKGFPILEPLSKKFTYPNEELYLEGKNLAFKDKSEVYFLSETSMVSATILSGTDFLIKVTVPESAISGPILYKTWLKEETLPRFIICGTIEIRK